jgi:hypothetical protein
MNSSYKKNNSLEKRKSEFVRVRSKYTDRIPVIVDSCKNLEKNFKKQKFLVSSDVSSSHLLCSIRSHIKLDSSVAIFMFIDNNLVCSTKMMRQIYEEYNEKHFKEPDYDGILYVYVTLENTFG